MSPTDWLSHLSEVLASFRITPIAMLVLVSAFAASSETAFFSLNRFQLRRIKERYKTAYDRIRKLLARPSRLLILLLLMNELVNLFISSMVTESLQHVLGEPKTKQQWISLTLISLAVSLPILLIFGEITPKVVAAKMNKFVAIFNSKLLIVFYKLLYPVLWAADAAISYTLRKLKAEGKDHLSKTMSVLSEEDFMLLMEEGHREGTVHQAERKLIKNVFEFDDSTVSEVMTPIGKAFSISATSRITEVLPEIRLQKYSRIPVFHKNKRNVVGIVYVKDLLALRNHPELGELDVKSLMTRAMYVGPNMRLSVLFRKLKESKTHMAVVLNQAASARSRLEDHYSREAASGDLHAEEAVGVVTMEDVLESIFGEISDERDVE